MSFLDRFRPAPKISARDIDPDALSVLHRLHHAGFVAYLVGGGVRDILLGRAPKDFDVATDARPGQIKRLFRNAFIIGRRFRLALIRFGEKQIETATFRRDPEPDDAPGPAAPGGGDPEATGALYQMSDNAFGTPEEDALRRDFTVNALFYDPFEDRVIDYVGGLRDLRKRVLRCIGDPNVRFREDPVRMLRAVRLSSRLGFTIHADALEAIGRYADEILAASRPRLFEEILRLFTFCRAEEAFRRLHATGLMERLLPDVAAQVGRSGGARAPLWRYLAALDRAFEKGLETEDRSDPHYVQENALRLAALLAPLYRERLAASNGNAMLLAEELVAGVLVRPFASPGWRPPRLLCEDLCCILESLVRYPSRNLRRRSAFSLPWFHTAMVFWNLCAEAEDDRSAAPALDHWREQFEQYASGPRPARRGRYVPTRPDSAEGRGFPGDQPEDRDSLFPGDRLRGRRRPRREAPPEGASEEPVSAPAPSVSEPAPSGADPEPGVEPAEHRSADPADPNAPRKRRRRHRGGRRHHRRADPESGGRPPASSDPAPPPAE